MHIDIAFGEFAINMFEECNDIWGKQQKWIQLTKEVEIKHVEILYCKRVTMKHVTRSGIQKCAHLLAFKWSSKPKLKKKNK
jgi:hypothetical protein